MKETIEEAAKQYASCEIEEGTMSGLRGIDASMYHPFIAGAQWQSRQSPWISVEERLPDTNNGQSLCEVLAQTNDGRFSVFANVQIEDLAERGEVVRWMPIPD